MRTAASHHLIAAQSESVGLDKIPWYLPLVGDEEAAEVAGTIQANFINMGPNTRAFEQMVAERLHVRHAIATTSGTAAITLALMAAGVTAGAEVIVPALTFIGTANAVCLAGGVPVLADIDRANFNLSVESVLARITPRTKAIVPVHINGRYCAVEQLRAGVAACGRQDIAIVEDAAEAFCSHAPGGYMGTLGLCGITSFAPTKVITTGQGGMVFTQDDAVAERVFRLRDQGRILHNSDQHDTIGYNFKFTDLQAAVGIAQMRKLDARLQRAHQIYAGYAAQLADLPALQFVPYNQAQGEVPIWVDIICAERDALYQYLLREGVSCRPFWTAIHQQPPYRLPDAMCPNAAWAHAQAMWLPSGPTLTDAQLQRVVALIHAFYAEGHGG